jgi:hypothetical protein
LKWLDQHHGRYAVDRNDLPKLARSAVIGEAGTTGICMEII